ncbi:MAG: addiction module protein [Planctomycetes bacterium]|nr:addiction module protein [Planctomycetota bacterium]
MSNTPAIDKLSVEERLALLEAVWESLAEREADITLSPDQLQLVRKRVADYRANPRPGMPLEQALAEIKAARK